MKRFTLLLTLLIFAWGSPLSAYVKTNLIYFPENGILPGPTVGEISGKVTISQEFTSQCSGSIQQIELYLATYARENTHPVYFHVLGPDQQVIAKNIISAKQILDNSWFMIPIPDLVDSKGKTYRINITSPESLHGNAITIYRSEGDDFPSGRALVDNHPLEYDLQFRYLCWQRLLPDWFYTSEVTGP